MKRQCLQCIVLLIFTFFSGIAYAQEPDRLDHIEINPNARFGSLDNGFTYYILNNKDSQKRVEIRLIVKAGSMNEGKYQTQYAHLLEHLAFTGTVHNKEDAFSYFETLGLVRGRHIGGSTTAKSTRYKLSIPDDNPELFKKSLEIVRDWCDGFLFEPRTVAKERNVVINELTRGADGSNRFSDEYLSWLLNSPKWTEGLKSNVLTDLKEFNQDLLVQFYKNWYHPQLQGLIIVGDIDDREVELQVREKFSKIAIPKQQPVIDNFPLFTRNGNHYLKLASASQKSIEIRLIKKLPLNRLQTVSDIKRSILGQLYNNMVIDRIEGISNQRERFFRTCLHSYEDRLPEAPEADLTSLCTTIIMDSLKDVIPGLMAVLTELERIKRYGFTNQELDEAKKTAYLSKSEVSTKSIVEGFVSHFTKGTAAPSPEYKFRVHNHLIDQITLDEINSNAKEWLDMGDQHIVVIGPENYKRFLPNKSEILECMATIGAANLESNKQDNRSQLHLKNPPPTATGGFLQKDYIQELEATQIILKNGMRIILKNVKPKGGSSEKILMHTFSPGGTLAYPDSSYFALKAAPVIVRESGIGGMDNFELTRYLKRKHVDVSPYIDDTHEGISGSCELAEFETLLKLVYLFFMEPNADKVAFDHYISNQKRLLQQDKLFSFDDSVVAILNLRDSKKPLLSNKKLNSISLDLAFSLYKDRFKAANDFICIITGEFDTTRVIPLLRQYLGSIPSDSRVEYAPKKEHGQIKTGPISQTIALRPNKDAAEVQLVYSGLYNFDLVNNVRMRVLARILELVIDARLREKEGGTYYVQCSAGLYKQNGGQFLYFVKFSCQQRDIERMISLALFEIENLYVYGISDALFDKALSIEKQLTNDLRKNNKSSMTYLVSKFKYGDSQGTNIFDKGLLDSVTREEINALFKQCFYNNKAMKFIFM